MTRRVLVTGGAGFVGRHLCERLLNDGRDVLCVDSLNPASSGAHPSVWPLFRPNTRRFEFLHEDCRAYFAREREPFDAVFHLAAMVGGRRMIDSEPLAVAVNLAIDADFWRWAKLVELGTVVYFSSSAAYPTSLQREVGHVRLAESMIDFDSAIGVPDMSYGWSKLTGEFLMRLYRRDTGRRAVAYRPFSGYGEDQSMDYPFPSICQRLIENAGRETVSVWGSGRQQRDFIHIDDCIDFIMRSYLEMPDGAALNLSSGVPTSFIELATLIAHRVGFQPKVVGSADKGEGVFFRCGDRTRQDQLGLTPAVSLESGIARSIDYLRTLR